MTQFVSERKIYMPGARGLHNQAIQTRDQAKMKRKESEREAEHVKSYQKVGDEIKAATAQQRADTASQEQAQLEDQARQLDAQAEQMENEATQIDAQEKQIQAEKDQQIRALEEKKQSLLGGGGGGGLL